MSVEPRQVSISEPLLVELMQTQKKLIEVIQAQTTQAANSANNQLSNQHQMNPAVNQTINSSNGASGSPANHQGASQSPYPAMNGSYNQFPTNYMMYQSMNPQAVNQMMSQSTNQLMNQTTNQPNALSMNQSPSQIQSTNQTSMNQLPIFPLFPVPLSDDHSIMHDQNDDTIDLSSNHQDVKPRKTKRRKRESKLTDPPTGLIQSVDQLIDQSIGSQMDQSTNQSVDQSMDQSMDLSMNRPIHSFMD